MGAVVGQSSAHAPLPAAACSHSTAGTGTRGSASAHGEGGETGQSSGFSSSYCSARGQGEVQLAAVGYTHKPFVHCRGEDSLTDLPLYASSCKSAVYREKLGLPREDGAETLLP